MGTPNIAIGSSPVSILTGKHGPVVVSNDGPSAVYIDDSGAVSPQASDYRLVPGDCITWAEDTPLWAITDLLTTASLSLSFNVTVFGGLRLYSTGLTALGVNEGGCTNATFTTLNNPDNDGINYRLAEWTTTGVLDVSSSGYAQVFIMSGGGAYGLFQFAQYGQGGEGSDVIFGTHFLTQGALAVTVGAAGVYVQDGAGLGGLSAIDTLQTRRPGSGLGYSGGVSTSITGVAQTLALPIIYGGTPLPGKVYARWPT